MTTSAVGNRAVATAAPAADDATSIRRGSHRRRNNATAWAFLAPFLVFFVLFLVWPMIHGIYLSLTDQSLTGSGGALIGIDNYLEAFADAEMWGAIWNTIWFTLLSTVPLVLVALVMALLVDQGLPGQWLWRLSYFMPFLLASTVVSLIWIWMMNPQLGLFNTVLQAVGLEPVPWLQDPSVSMISIVIATVWWTVGFNFLLYLAALQNIPEQQYEAASIDGAGKWRQLFGITLPQLGPTTALIVILQVLASLKVFDQIYQMMNQLVTPATQSAVIYIFDVGFTGYRFGYSSAISYIFFAIVLIVSLVQFRVTARRGA
ncbi:multiple sugar transport system permease protein/raffinose/stachyose/melibiose transport system permease protein [Diaminobutyricimonas aerilata]|uniref:Multiple sugar transport system permease protein/raffinose/stachyose/melibiose transport system permease protein n=1 Tax=Diaminobutyricimonas aerilata TaxID=1162967 RepID=A0A2M9CLS3_9MICO|nr:sugar ABC transporter permease [Diaminobutyricimonas aerilata]PJJ72841.1 multiple sugar transport system permease protein/raffinose/stachyose/melibiose transport system permease protein [Diaminobutyricimonas aerilata]